MKYPPFIYQETVIHLPLNYRYIRQMEIKQTKELNEGRRFSESDLHNSKNYVTAENYKPISTLFITDL